MRHANPLSLHRVFKKASPNGKVSPQQLHPSSSLTPNSCPLLGMCTDHAGPPTPSSEALRSLRHSGRGLLRSLPRTFRSPCSGVGRPSQPQREFSVSAVTGVSPRVSGHCPPLTPRCERPWSLSAEPWCHLVHRGSSCTCPASFLSTGPQLCPAFLSVQQTDITDIIHVRSQRVGGGWEGIWR